MNKGPTVFAVFESKKAWEEQNPELAKNGYGRFLEDDESISSTIDDIRQGGTDIIAWRYQPGEFAILLEKLRSVSQSILWNLTDGYDFFFRRESAGICPVGLHPACWLGQLHANAVSKQTPFESGGSIAGGFCGTWSKLQRGGNWITPDSV